MIVAAVIGLFSMAALLLYSERALILEERKRGVQQTVSAALGVVKYFQGQVAQGKLSTAQAQQYALAELRTLRYGDGEYFWVNDLQPKMLMHPIKPELDQTDLRDVVDPDNKRLFVEMADVVRKEGKGFVFYRWPKPGIDKPQPKVSFVQGVPEWGWVVGSGLYTDGIDETMSKTAIAIGLGGLALAGVLFLLGRGIANSITRPLDIAINAAERIAGGNLAGQIKPGADDEVGKLMTSLATMNSNLVSIVERVREGTNAINMTSSQIASGNVDLSARTEQQASALQETAASMEQLTATVKQNAEYAVRAHDMAVSASTIATTGGTTVAKVVESMDAIRASSNKIVEIISVIDGIAFQTNILALNAAVEAARAGEQGRGFAVVASEVRNLAQRAATASKQIAALIEASVQQVGTGAQYVQQAGQTMQKIVVEISGVASVMEQITHASKEQATGLEQVTAAVSEMDQVTQQNAVLVEEAASSSVSLREQAEQLSIAVSAFELKAPSIERKTSREPLLVTT